MTRRELRISGAGAQDHNRWLFGEDLFSINKISCSSIPPELFVSGVMLHPLPGISNGKPLFIVPSAGSSPLSLFDLARQLSVPALGFSFPGLEDSLPPKTSIEEMSTAFVDSVRQRQPEGPYSICGHCWGGTVALDMASKLEQAGESVDVLILLESLPPVPSQDARSTETLDTGARTGTMNSRQALKIMLEQIDANISKLPAVLRPRFEKFCHDQIQMAGNFRAMPIDARIVLLRTPCFPRSVFNRWSMFSNNGCTDRIIPGDQFSMLHSPHVEIVASRIAEQLASSS
ncbi:MAG: alpha/beta fold hydrolase [Arenicellales bacterium]